MEPQAEVPKARHIVFACGGQWYAVPSEFAVEVVTFPELTAVPGAPKHLLGIFPHRGEIVPVVDLARLTGGGAENTRRAVLLRLPGGCYALSARTVAGVMELSGTWAPQEGEGVFAYLSAPSQEKDRSVAFVEAEGLYAYLSQRAGTSTFR